jgi:hypothetical protein
MEATRPDWRHSLGNQLMPAFGRKPDVANAIGAMGLGDEMPYRPMTKDVIMSRIKRADYFNPAIVLIPYDAVFARDSRS